MDSGGGKKPNIQQPRLVSAVPTGRGEARDPQNPNPESAHKNQRNKNQQKRVTMSSPADLLSILNGQRPMAGVSAGGSSGPSETTILQFKAGESDGPGSNNRDLFFRRASYAFHHLSPAIQGR